MRPRIPKVVAGGLAAAVLTAAIGGAAFAQVSSPTATPPAAVQQKAQDFLNALAGKLNKTPTEVQAAFKAVEKDRIAQAVKDGRLTQAQADEMNRRIDASTGIGPFGGRGFGGGHEKGGKGQAGPGRGGVGVDATALASFFGYATPAELRTALQGKSMAALAVEKGKTRDQLKAFLTQQEQTRLNQAVTDGRITRTQADQRLADLATRLDQMIDRVGPTGGPGGARGPRGPRGQGPQGQASPTARQ
jgi:hypothetical protein